ncbi:unnamed protein product [Psylliodes chrysocephalus]|uniref:Uncharacterized protein n=1 Tax=Psylliodes chrysocephalus TaxID=3402493 RepID=A0A9P0CFY3_9CUCU|nr:unnamed protein product [Psylliodes chrysocephala]
MEVKLKSKIKAEDLINVECSIPEKLERFYKVLTGGKDIRQRDGINCDRLTNSMASDAIFCINSGTVKPSKHITLGLTIKSLTNSRKLINILNRFGHCYNYNTLEEFKTEAIVASVDCSQISSPLICTGVAFYNFDRFVDTLNEKETLPDTVGIIYQNIDNRAQEELNVDNARTIKKKEEEPLMLFQVLENNDIPEDNSDNDESNDHNESSDDDDDDDFEDGLF